MVKRAHYTAAGGFTDGNQRMSEVFIFEAVPEPSTFVLAGAGLGIMLTMIRRRRS